MSATELHKPSRRGSTRLWKVWVEDDTVHVEYGDLGGKMQHTADTKKAKNVGKSNEKSPETVALEDMDRLIKLKKRRGYKVPEAEEASAEVRLLDRLPEGLCFYKPANTMSWYMTKLLEVGGAWLTRKRDGNMMVLVRNLDGYMHIYSRMMLDHMDKEPSRPFTERFFHICEEAMRVMEPGTVVLGEIVADELVDDFNYVGTLVKSKTDKALEVQNSGTGWAHFYVWDIAWVDGEEILSHWKHRDRLVLAQDMFADLDFILPPEVVVVEDLETPDDSTHTKQAQEVAKEFGWEGWVVIDPNGVLGDRAWNLRGTPERSAKVSCKLKPTYEVDAIAYWDGTYGTGKHQDGIKNLTLYQLGKDGEPVEIGKVSSGLTDAQKKELADEDLYPKVVQVEFHEWTAKKKLRIPSVVRFRDDKMPIECRNEEL